LPDVERAGKVEVPVRNELRDPVAIGFHRRERSIESCEVVRPRRAVPVSYRTVVLDVVVARHYGLACTQLGSALLPDLSGGKRVVSLDAHALDANHAVNVDASARCYVICDCRSSAGPTNTIKHSLYRFF